MSVNERQSQLKLRQLSRWVEVYFPVPIHTVCRDAERPRRQRDLPDRGRCRCLAALRPRSCKLIATVALIVGSRTQIHS